MNPAYAAVSSEPGRSPPFPRGYSLGTCPVGLRRSLVSITWANEFEYAVDRIWPDGGWPALPEYYE